MPDQIILQKGNNRNKDKSSRKDNLGLDRENISQQPTAPNIV